MTNSVSLDRVEIQTRPLGHSAENSYCIWLRYEGEIAGRTLVDIEGPLTPEQAADKGFPLDVVLGEVTAAAIRQASSAQSDLQAAREEIRRLEAQVVALTAALP